MIEGLSSLLSLLGSLFSGLGTKFIEQLITPRRNQGYTSQKPQSESEQIRRRFNKLLALMNEGRTYKPFRIASLAKIMELERPSELEGIFNGELKPTFRFIENFCGHFGVNETWLTEGTGAPFEADGPKHSYAIDFYPIICENDPEAIFLVRAKTARSEALIVLQLSDHKYQVLPIVWNISGEVGGEGARQLVSFYNLANKLQAGKLYVRCYGRTLPESKFWQLFNGEIFAGELLGFGFGNSYWWDDLTDIHHKYPLADNYKSWHGANFIDAQKIIKRRLEAAN